MNKIFSCPVCGAKNNVDIDLTGIKDGEVYHQSEDCDECNKPFIAFVRARYETGAVGIEWPEPT